MLISEQFGIFVISSLSNGIPRLMYLHLDPTRPVIVVPSFRRWTQRTVSSILLQWPIGIDRWSSMVIRIKVFVLTTCSRYACWDVRHSFADLAVVFPIFWRLDSCSFFYICSTEPMQLCRTLLCNFCAVFGEFNCACSIFTDLFCVRHVYAGELRCWDGFSNNGRHSGWGIERVHFLDHVLLGIYGSKHHVIRSHDKNIIACKSSAIMSNVALLVRQSSRKATCNY